MAFTKIVGAGIHTLSNVHSHNINSSGIITATSFVGPFNGSDGDFSGNVTIDGNLIVNGDTTTLNTTLREVEILRVDANNSTVGAAITQSGSGDILNLYDGSTEVFSVDASGRVKIGTTSNKPAAANEAGIVFGDNTAGTVKKGVASFCADGAAPLLLTRRVSDGNVLGIADDAGTKGLIRVNSNDLEITAIEELRLSTNTGHNERVRLTNDGDVKILTGTLHIPDTLQHHGDPDTKIRFPADNTISFETGGTQAVKIDSNQRLIIATGGTGNASVYADDIFISGSGARGITIHTTSTSGSRPGCLFFGEGTSVSDMASGVILFEHNGNYMHFSAGGSVNVGKSIRLNNDGTVRFDSTPTDANSQSLLIKSLKARAVNDRNGINFRDAVDHTQASIYVEKKSTSNSQSDLVFRTSDGSNNVTNTLVGGGERLRIDSSGRVMIGSSDVGRSGAQNLTIGSGSGDQGMTIRSGTSHEGNIYFSDGSSGGNEESRGIFRFDHSNDSFQFYTASGNNFSQERLRILSDGKVGIGTDTPNGDLQIRAGQNASFRVLADPSTSGLFVGNYGSGDGYRSLSLLGSVIRLHTVTAGALSGATEKVTIASDGKVGIGSDIPSKTLDVSGNIRCGHFTIDRHGQPTIMMTSTSDTGGGAIYFGSPASGVRGGILYDHNGDKLQFRNIYGTSIEITNDRISTFYGDINIQKGSGYPTAELKLQTHDTANSTAGIRLLARDNSNNNETCRILATSDSGENVNLRLYTDDNSNKGMRINGSDGGVSFVGSSNSTLGYTFQNATGNANSDTRVLIRTYSNYGADPYVKFDSGGTNHVVGQLYAGTTNNKLVLGAGESPSGGVSGIHIAGDGITQITNHISMTKSSDPRIYSGSSVGLNIDGQALYLNRYVNSTIAMGRGGGSVEVSNTNNGNDSQLNIYKSSGGGADDAVLRVGYDSSNCLSIQRQLNSSQIKIDYNQSDAILRFQANGDDTMILTNRQNVNVAKFTPLVTSHREIVSNSSWAGGRPIKFYMRFSTGNFSGTYHVARMISQNDWGFADWQVKVLRDYYSPDTHDGALTRYTGYYNSHSETVVTYNMRNNAETGPYGSGRRLSTNTNLGPGGAHRIHESANGGYYKDAYATDYYINLGNYSGVMLEITINNPGGYLKDTSTTLTDTYPAAFGQQATQSQADSWNGATSGGGRGLWFNVRQGVLDTSWMGAGTSGNAYNYGQQNLPIS